MQLKGLFLLSMTCGWLFAGPLDEWHSRTNFGAEYLDDIAYGANVWVMVDGLPGQIITATNLASAGAFSRRNVGTRPYAVEYGAGRFVVTCREGALMSSADGVNWMTHAAAGGGYSSLLFANGRFVTVGNKISATSTNGADWTTTPMSGPYSADIAFGNGIFVAGGGKTNAISTDGMTWEEVPSGIPTGFYTVGFGDGKFVGITTQNEIMISRDARSWTAHGRLDLLRPGRIAWGNGYFVTAGGSARAYSRDGISWTVMASGTTEYNVEFINSSFIATGYKTIYQSSRIIELRARNAGELQLFGESGRSYRIDSSEDLESWQTHSTAQISAGESSCVFRQIQETTGPRRFFRAVVSE